MRRVMVLMIAGLLAASSSVSGQVPGDSLRIRLGPSADWQSGRYVRTDSAGLILRVGLTDQPFHVASIVRAEVWKKSNALVNILGSTAIGGVVWGIGNEIDSDHAPVTGTKGGDIMLGAGVGALVGVISVLVSPGSWKQIVLRVR